MRTSIVAAVLVVAGVTTTAGQVSQVEATLPPVFTGAIRAIEPPPQRGGWTLQVISRGGLDTRVTDLTIRSDSASLHPDTLVSLSQRIRTVTTPRWTVDSRLGICSDCAATLIVLTMRDANGLVQNYAAYWDATTRTAIPADVLRLHDLAVTLR